MFGTKKHTTTDNYPLNNGGIEEGAYTKIGRGTVVDGEIKSEGDIRVDGKVNGFIQSSTKVVVGESGYITGDVEADNADVSGTIVGKLVVKGLLFIKATANIQGEISTSKLVVEEGATFNGGCNTGTVKAGKDARTERQLETNFKKKAV